MTVTLVQNGRERGHNCYDHHVRVGGGGREKRAAVEEDEKRLILGGFGGGVGDVKPNVTAGFKRDYDISGFDTGLGVQVSDNHGGDVEALDSSVIVDFEERGYWLKLKSNL
ncbi:hypothetical protein TIFTF001_043315 [Ficus carica]|uniref:Uncharacterized protein n=1 Tax=Ficus carica TaxID=3494 RepID=A0AA88CLP8_FICCA|nr:hypothetical protein TIFTF001_043315 [Ficus carica]